MFLQKKLLSKLIKTTLKKTNFESIFKTHNFITFKFMFLQKNYISKKKTTFKTTKNYL